MFSALGDGDHDGTDLDDLRTKFPDAPVGGPAMLIEQSVTRAQLEQAAANLRKVGGVRAAQVVEVTGLWFTVSATGPAAAPLVPAAGKKPTPETVDIDTSGLDILGSAGGSNHDARNGWVHWVRATFAGPFMDRASFDLLRHRAAAAAHVDISQVVVTAESANPKPTKS